MIVARHVIGDSFRDTGWDGTMNAERLITSLVYLRAFFRPLAKVPGLHCFSARAKARGR